jgi:hypothetical protein
LRVGRKRLHPVAQKVRMNVQVARSLCHRHATLPNQLHSLKLELTPMSLSFHTPPPVPSSHLNSVSVKPAAAHLAASPHAQILCKLEIDSHEVMNIFCQDRRLNISTAYLRPGFAFGGSCLPKDLRALTYLARKLDLSLPILNHILDSNRMLIDRGVDWILAQSRKRVAFLGISFKSGTDDVRESPFVDLVERLMGKGCEIRIFDPNVHLAHMVGANKDYLTRVVPHIAELIVPKISDAIVWAETIVVTSADPVYVAGLAKLRPEQVVLDFAHLKTPSDVGVKVRYFGETKSQGLIAGLNSTKHRISAS